MDLQYLGYQAGKLIVGALCGLLLGWWLWHHAPVIEGSAPERKLPNGGLVVERDPSAEPAKPIVQAAREAGGTPMRFIHARIQPSAPVQASPLPMPHETSPPGGSAAAAAAPPQIPTQTELVCPPVDVDLALVEKGDGSLRAVLTSSGQVLEAKDIPVRNITARAVTRWAAGVSAQAIVTGSELRHYGVWIERDLGPFRLGTEVQATAGGKDPAVWVRAGMRF